MKDNTYSKFIGLALLVLAGLAQVADGQNRSVRREAEQKSGDTFSVTMVSAKGVNIYAVKQPSKKMVDAIDQGLTDLFAVARKNNYNRNLNYSDYSIYIANADRTKNFEGNYSPDIAIGSAQYAGTIYDKGGYIYVAGIVLSNSPSAFMIGAHTKEFNRVSDAVRYEGEHLVLYHNDRRRYRQTADHSQGGGHPILQ